MVKTTQNKQDVLSLNKRKRGILRKVMELASISGQQIYISIGDPKTNTFAEYQSDAKINREEINNFEVYSDGDYEALESKFVTKKMLGKIQNKHKDRAESQIDQQVEETSETLPNLKKNPLSKKINKK